jgi:pimeloyl-ACP methyl ester carboxylesterase
VRQEMVNVADGVELACFVTGSGPPVVCLPGWSQAAEQFLPVAYHLASRHRVVGIDHRGHGKSTQVATATASTASQSTFTRSCASWHSKM